MLKRVAGLAFVCCLAAIARAGGAGEVWASYDAPPILAPLREA